jgi:hypothetical protein
MAVTINANSSTGFIATSDTSGVLQLQTGGTTALTVDASQNLGIGTVSPVTGTRLHVHESASTISRIRLTNSTTTDASGKGLGIFQSGVDTYITNNEVGILAFSTSGTERARITSAGNLLVATPSEISVAGVTADHALIGTTGNGRWATAVRNTGNSTPWGLAIQYSAAAPNNTSQNFLYCYDTVAEKCSIRSNGGVANYSANDVNLSSDLRLKHDIEPVQSYWNVFKSIKWKTWLYNDQTDEIKNIGVIAQELQALAPEFVCESNALPTPEGESPYLGLWENDFKMAGMSVITELVKRCEEQQALITQLQADVAALKGASA